MPLWVSRSIAIASWVLNAALLLGLVMIFRLLADNGSTVYNDRDDELMMQGAEIRNALYQYRTLTPLEEHLLYWKEHEWIET